MDFITQLPKTKSGHDAILVFVDKLTKMVKLAPTVTQCTSETTAELFVRQVFRYHGVPNVIVSDRDTRFMHAQGVLRDSNDATRDFTS